MSPIWDTSDIRDEIARMLEDIDRQGQNSFGGAFAHPRSLDAALDAIDEEYKAKLLPERMANVAVKRLLRLEVAQQAEKAAKAEHEAATVKLRLAKLTTAMRSYESQTGVTMFPLFKEGFLRWAGEIESRVPVEDTDEDA